ncbi:MAG: nucleoside hydrolase, partial [Anaerolineales bacterium]|nr:nucleoside hydrolase [Anaerolineales bacterium]MDW8447359.1 nucleoside hydrolase [Anaerolineales bacterium]
ASPELRVEGLSVVHGNCSVDQGVTNALSVLELARATHVPVVRGCERPLVQPSLLAPETHGQTGLGYAQLPPPHTKPLSQHACDFLIERVLSAPGEITIVAIGPLTNLALALRKEPRLAQAVKELFIMGGAIRHEGNTTPLAEFNTYVDPHAAHIVFHSGIPITLVPLDVTYQCILTEAHLQKLDPLPSPIPAFLRQATRYYMEFHDQYQAIAGCVINDPLALALTFRPDLCDYQELYVDVDISGGVCMGKTFADFYHMTGKPANMRVALGVCVNAFLDFFVQRIATLSRKLLNEEVEQEG